MTAPHRTFVFSDSEVASVTTDGDMLRVRFAAAHVTQPNGGTLSGRQRGYVDGVELVCRGGPWPPIPPEALGRLADGRVRAGGVWVTQVPLPAELGGPVALELHFANRSVLDLSATSLSLAAPPGAVFGESLAC